MFSTKTCTKKSSLYVIQKNEIAIKAYFPSRACHFFASPAEEERKVNFLGLPAIALILFFWCESGSNPARRKVPVLLLKMKYAPCKEKFAQSVEKGLLYLDGGVIADYANRKPGA